VGRPSRLAPSGTLTVKAARRFATSSLASDTAFRFTTDRREARRYVDLEQEDAENDDRTMAQASPHIARMRRK